MLKPPEPRRPARPDEAGLRAEILHLNLKRTFRLALILVPVHIAHVVLFWRHISGDDPASESWRQGIMVAHAVMLPIASAIAALAHAAGRGRLSHRARVLLPGATALTYLLFGATLAIIDQQVTSSITPFLLSTVGVASTLLMHPIVAAIAFTILLTAFWFLVAWTQPNPDLLLSLRVNTISLTGIGFGISFVIWQSQVLALRQREEIEAQKRALEEKNDELARLVTRDPLTGVSNRSHLATAAATEVARLRRSGGSASLVLLDLDHFKEVNDGYGHPAGDDVLRQVAQVLAAGVREMDTLARMGGEEFTILLPDTPANEAAEVAERLRDAIEKHPFSAGGVQLKLTASFGVSALPLGAADAFSAAYRAADRALYRAKEGGRNQVCVADLTMVLE